jgi:hypothetical protein
VEVSRGAAGRHRHRRRRRRRIRETAGGLDTGGPTVVVTRTVAGRVRGTCRDRGAGAGLGLTRRPAVRHGDARIGLPRGGTDLWSERCAGPVSADLPSAPAIRLPFPAILRRDSAASVSVARRFARGGWARIVTRRPAATR